MFSRCVFCQSPLGSNDVLEHFPHGRKVAFDPARGRLWAVCGACRRWNLAPFETRWEAMEELERLTTDRARLLTQTDNVALLRAGEMTLVRVGRAPLAEEAWWRYGREMIRRRGMAYLLWTLDFALLPVFSHAARAGKFGRTAWEGGPACARCGEPLPAIRYTRSGALLLAPGADGGMALHLPCPRCDDTSGPAGHLLEGADARLLLRRVLAYDNFAGASHGDVAGAAAAIDAAGSAAALASDMARRYTSLSELRNSPPVRSIALEIAVNDETERRLLHAEAAELERQWKEEEEIAAIADRDLVFLPRSPDDEAA